MLQLAAGAPPGPACRHHGGQAGPPAGPAVPVWDVLASSYVSGATREQLLAGFGSGALGLAALTRRLTTIIEEVEAAGGPERAPGDAAGVQQEPRPAGPGGSDGGRGAGPSPGEAATEPAGGPQEQALRAATMEVQAGPLRGQRPSVWDVLFSSYLSRARRDELLAQHAAGALALPGLVAILTRAVEEAEERLSKVTFRGLRRQVSASELRSSGILGPETLRDLAQGTKTPQEVTEMDSVKRYLRGTSCIAGVLVPAKDEPGRQEKMSVYQAMWKGVLRPGTALVLLEAQAATGFLIDPVRNQGLTVEEAVAAGLVGGEIQDKLLSAERAVTGYTDPYTGEQISLFQAMQKELIVRDHGIRLLEAQVATGGIIDPVHSHRLPVDVAYQRGYFDEEMNRVLADPSDDTKGFFDPNTHENLTYVQLLRRCVLDPDTGLYMLQLAAGGSAVHQLSEELRGALRDARVAPGPGVAQGQSVSVWELLFYREVPEGERQDLLRRYRAGSLTAHEVGAALTALLARRDPASPGARPPDPRGALRAATMEVKLGRLRGPAVPVWDVLASSYVSGATREQLLAGFGSGALGLAALTRRLTTIIEEVEAAGGPERAPGDAAGVQQEPRPAGPGGSDGGRGAGPSPGEAATEPAGGPQEQALRAATMEVQAGPLRGQRPSVWDVLFSSYLSRARRDELLAQHAAGALALPGLVAILTRAVEEAEERLSKVTFRGLRRQVSASELRSSGILGPETLRDLAQGTKTPQEVTEMDSVKRYLRGTSCIAGVLVPAKDEPGRQEKMSVYQAMWKGVLRPGTALVLLEAQAATGFLIDPVRNQGLTVEEAVAAGLVGGEIQDKLLSAERAVTGYTDPYTGEQISLFQAMQKELIVRDHGIRLLEAQVATGGIIDPVHSHRLPVDVAYQRGYFDEEMNRVLADPSDDTKGFFDPNTHENLTYALRAATMEVQAGPLRGQRPSVWDVLFSSYLSRARRDELLAQHAAGALALPGLVAILTRAVEEAEERLSKVTFRGLRRQVSASELRSSGILGPETLRDLAQGTKTPQEVTEMDSVKRYLRGTSCIAGVLVPAKDEPGRQEKMSVYQAMWKGAQAATGFLIDPVRNQGLTVEEAVAAGLVGGEIQDKLLSAERAVTGYTDPYTGEQISLFQAMQKELIVRDHGIRLLEAQVATGGIIDPVHSHRLPVDVAYQRGYFDEEMNRVLADPSDDTKGFFDPNTHENLTYVQLLRRCVLDPDTGLYMLQLAAGAPPGPACRHHGGQAGPPAGAGGARALRAATMEVQAGPLRGQRPSVWDVLFSSYLSRARRDELLAQHAAGALALPGLVAILTRAVEEAEERLSKVTFRGLRRQVSASELRSSGILGPETLRDLAQGTKTPQEVTEMDSVKRYLRGTSCIAGVLVPAKDEPGRQEKMSVYQAMWKGVLRPGTALVLLEAQAATGFLIDPVRNQGLTVEEAVAAGLVGGEIQDKLLSAERAVTGYTDPYTGEQISLFQAMQKELIVRDHGIRLLEAQVATGGIIDPVHSHRLPVDVAYQRGYFDEEMNRVLADPSDDTKGFFDPNTHENLTYVQLLRRCVLDPDTGLYMLQLAAGAPPCTS
ncbi:unnamed protein product [Nyctereutes procyonoides]|uniref:(raccoon dog) hypothetical protein n=1 Tax=Nyctereutes procyonoides TaxID=34880 RepID=A0A811XVV9_NYCPR|nr:unnamed protein product [Nyctereutes procyonoides]